MALRTPTVLMAALAPLLAVGCDDDETVTLDVGQTGDPSIEFIDPLTDEPPTPREGEDYWCVAIGEDADAEAPLLVNVEHFDLRPPGSCGSHVQCGHLQLYVDGVLNNESSVSTIPLVLVKLADRYHDGTVHEGTGQPDILTVRVDVVDSERNLFEDHDGQPLTDTLELITVPSCDEP